MFEALRERAASEGIVVAGVLSGTSADGIDVAIARFGLASDELELRQMLAFETTPFDPDLWQRVRVALDGETVDLRASALLSRDLGRAFGRAAARLAAARGIRLDLVGSHGQTVYHHDGNEPSGGATLQLGDGDFVREAIGCPVVCDFRQRDIAAGGEGAPLSALSDPCLFAKAPRPLAILNLGGMANLTWLGEDGDLHAFDSGPAGALLDGLARRLFDRPYDENGQLAARGQVLDSVARAWLTHPFFEAAPPKSTGRDTFGSAWIDECCRARHDPHDLLATGVHVVARSVHDAYRRFLPGPASELVVCGGGVHHSGVMGELERRFDVPVATTERYGVDPDAREGLVFACLAAAAALGLPASHPGATGAPAGRVLGKICP